MGKVKTAIKKAGKSVKPKRARGRSQLMTNTSPSKPSNCPLTVAKAKKIIDFMYKSRSQEMQEVADKFQISKPTLIKLRTGEHCLWEQLELEGVKFIPSLMHLFSNGGVGFLKTLKEKQLDRRRSHNLLYADKFVKKFKTIQIEYFLDRRKNPRCNAQNLLNKFKVLDKEWLSINEAKSKEEKLKDTDELTWRLNRKSVLQLGAFNTKCPIRNRVVDKCMKKADKIFKKEKAKRHEQAELNRAVRMNRPLKLGKY